MFLGESKGTDDLVIGITAGRKMAFRFRFLPCWSLYSQLRLFFLAFEWYATKRIGRKSTHIRMIHYRVHNFSHPRRAAGERKGAWRRGSRAGLDFIS